MHVEQGVLVGQERQGVQAFLGVPFADPPVGENRWRAPQPAQAWSGERAALDHGPGCMQTPHYDGLAPWTSEYWPQTEFSEDCLYLNIWAPESAVGSPQLPVLMFIHGGGFTSGSGEVPLYNGEALARRGIVVVTINYRLGVFGFLAHPELTREAGQEPPANFGLQDQIAALKWIKANIAEFGGDPNAVTIAGQSAGSYAVHALVASPLASGLFRGGIAARGLPAISKAASLAAAEADGLAYAESMGAASLAELRAIPALTYVAPPIDLQKLRNTMKERLRFLPIIDGRLLPDDPTRLVMEGRANDVPLMVGKTFDEGSALTPGWGARTEDDFRGLLTRLFGDKASEFAALYPAADDDARADASKTILNDVGMMAIHQWAAERSNRLSAPIYVYRFDHAEPGPESIRWAAFHSSDLTYFFDNLLTAPTRDFAADDRVLADKAASAWVSFVKTGIPAVPGAEAWPPFKAGQPKIMRFGAPARVEDFLDPDRFRPLEEFQRSGGKLSVF